MDDVLNELRERLCLIGLAGGDIGNQAGVEVHADLIPCTDLLSGLLAFQNGQTDVDGVSVKNSGEALGDDAAGAAGLDDQRSSSSYLSSYRPVRLERSMVHS